MELKQFMKTHRWKCIDIAEAVNVSPATISQIANKKRDPSLGLARKLVEFSKRKVRYEDLLSGDGQEQGQLEKNETGK